MDRYSFSFELLVHLQNATTTIVNMIVKLLFIRCLQMLPKLLPDLPHAASLALEFLLGRRISLIISGSTRCTSRAQ